MHLKFKQRIDNLIGGSLVALHLIPVRFLGKILRLNHNLNQAPQNIIILKMLGFGSLILASDAILAIKKKYPNCKFTLICSSSLDEGAASLKLYDNILNIYDKSIFTLIKSSLNVIFQCLKLKDKWCFDFEVYSRLTTIFSLYTFSKNRFGFEFEKVNFRNYLNTHNTYFNLFIPTEENYNKMAENIGAIISERYFLPQKNDNKEYKYIVINNTCSDLSIQRKLESWQIIDIINYIQTETKYTVALAGSPADKLTNEQIIAQIDNSESIENWAGKHSFNKYLELLANQTKAMITIDSAPLHIAARLEIPLLAIWGPTQPQSLAPKWLRESALYKEINLSVNCSPCVHHTKELPCGGNNFCIKNITSVQLKSYLSDFING